tara:strand:- start:21675 stop:21896 length:222 start_codon:yes stop_codon:yes gene_type:complete
MRVDLIKKTITEVNAKLTDYSYDLRQGNGFYAIDKNDKYSGLDEKVAFAGSKKECYIYISGVEEGVSLKENIR